MYLLKKIVGTLLTPLPMSLILIGVGLALLWFTRRQKAGRIVATVGFALLGVLSFDLTSGLLLEPLEQRYPALFLNGEEQKRRLADVRWVVVMGGGHTTDPRVPVTSQIGSAALGRLTEAIRLHRQLPGTRLILSGAAVYDPTPQAVILAEVAKVLGVPAAEIVIHTSAPDTEQEVQSLREIIKQDRFIVVTSAAHMPRAMALFRRQGLLPIAAPADHEVKDNDRLSPFDLFPSSNGLRKTESALHEYIGTAWLKLRGRLLIQAPTSAPGPQA